MVSRNLKKVERMLCLIVKKINIPTIQFLDLGFGEGDLKAYIPLQHETTRVGLSHWFRPPNATFSFSRWRYQHVPSQHTTTA